MLSNKNKYLCFLTLTTRYDRLFNVIYGISGVPKKSLKRLTDNFQKLVRMIRRKYGKFDYIRVRTQEGGGVLHILFKGCYLDVDWLRKKWKKLHSATQLYITHCYGFLNRISGYLAYYMGRQLANFSYSSGS